MEYRSNRSNGGEVLNGNGGFNMQTSSHFHHDHRSTSVGRFSSRENSPAAVKYSSDNVQNTKDKQHRRFNLFRRKNKSTDTPNQQQGPSLCSSSDESSSSSSLSSSSNNNKNVNNNYLSSSQNRGSLLSTLSRKCSQKFRNFTSDVGKRERSRADNNCQKITANGVHREDIISNHVLSGGGSSEAVNGRRQSKTDGHYGKFDLFSSCRKNPGSPRESLDSISRRVRKDALKARVEAQREQQYPDSSSDDEDQFIERAQYMRRYHSDESLHQRWLGDRQSSKTNRTERYYSRRKGKDEDSSSKGDEHPTSSKEFIQNPTYIRRNLTISGTHNLSASPCSSPLPRVDFPLQQRENGKHLHRRHFRKYEEIHSQAATAQYSSSSVRTSHKSREENSLENVVVSGYLPLRKANVVDGHLHRAPTPPMRVASNQPHSRPRSFNFEDVHVNNGGRNAWGNGAGPTTLVMSSNDCPPNQDFTRPLSFTSTSQVFYNHNVPNVISDNRNNATMSNGGGLPNNAENDARNHRILRLSVSPEHPAVAYMSDSQILGQSRSTMNNNGGNYEAAWRKQSQQLNKNFNSVPKPWNTFGISDESVVNSTADLSTVSSRPPPSPSRNVESFGFGVANGPQSPKYSTHMQAKIGQPLKSQPQQMPFNRRYQNDLSDGFYNDQNGSGRATLVTSPPLPPARRYFRQQQSRSSNLESVSHRLGKLVNGGNNGNNKSKSSDNHLEDALLELEKIYHSMKSNDDDAEEHLSSKGRRNSTCEELLLRSNWASNKDDIESSKDSTLINGEGCYNTLDGRPRSAQGNRNSAAFPNKITDDLAYRKIARQSEANTRPSYVVATGSYLLKSPALSPSVSADDVRTFKNSNGTSNEPDTVLDDLSFRNIRDANLQKVIDPQPLFGIPLGPISNAASTDYMHAQAQDLSRPKMRRRFRPDVVKDDLAYRNLRKDTSSDNNSAKLNFEELDSILSSEFQQMINGNRKKHRAARSLSANLSQIIHQNKMLGQTSSTKNLLNTANSNDEKSSSVTDLRCTNDVAKNTNSNNTPLLIKAKPREDSHNNATSSSTDTLTELGAAQPPLISSKQLFSAQNSDSAFRPVSLEDKSDVKSTNDIWQLRITVGTEPVVTDVHHLVQQVGKKAEEGNTGHTIVKPIPLKFDSYRNQSFRNFVNDELQSKTKGSPIDEVKLDELLSSLALETAQTPPVVTCNGKQSTNGLKKLDENLCDNKSSSETFPALVTVDGSGEMSVKILFPHLKLNSALENENDEDQKSAADRRIKAASGSSPKDTADGRVRREMSSVPTRSKIPSTTQNVDEKFVNTRTRSPLTLNKDGATLNERTVNLKRSTAFNIKNLGNSKTSTSVNNSNTIMPDSESQSERVARYKEERRKQLANQFGQWTSKDENSSLKTEPSYMRYSQRAKRDSPTNGPDTTKSVSKNGGPEEIGRSRSFRVENKHRESPPVTSNTENCKVETNESTTKNIERTSSPVDGMVRLNRASRLRAQARATESVTPEPNSRPGSFRSKIPYACSSNKDQSPVKSSVWSPTPVSSSSEAPVSSTNFVGNNHVVANESESGETDSVTGKPKDKSAKRKSNLNRMGSVDSTPIPSDSGDDTPRRFRRQRHSFADKSSNCSTDGVQSDSIKTTRPPRSVPSAAQSPSLSKSVNKIISSLGKKDGKVGVKAVDVEDGTSESDADRKNILRRFKKGALKKPEIPDVLRPKSWSLSTETSANSSQNQLSSSFIHPINVPIATESKPKTEEVTTKHNDVEKSRFYKSTSSSTSSSNDFSILNNASNIKLNAQETVAVAEDNELKPRDNYLLQELKVGFSKSVEEMGGKLFKASSNSEIDASTVNQLRVSDDVGHSETDDYKCDNFERGHYDPSGNWQLGKSLTDVYSFNNEADKAFKSSATNSEVKNRMAFAYGIKDVNNIDNNLSLGEASGWTSQSSPVLKRKTPSLNYTVTIPVNNDDDLSSRRSVSSDEMWSSLENENKARHGEPETSGNKSAVIILDGASASQLSRRKKSNDDNEFPTKSILKPKEDLRTGDGKPPPVPHSILKRGSFDEISRSRSPEKCSILKKRGSSEDSDHHSDSPEIVSILRRKSSEELEDASERQSILRRKSMLDETEHSRSSEFHSILKKQCSLDVMDLSHAEPRPILKKKSSSEEIEQSEPKPILKKRSSTEEECEEKPKPILKLRRRSGQEDLLEVVTPSEQVELRRTARLKTSSPVLRFRHLDEDLPSVPNRLSSASSRHHTSSDDEFVSVPSSPGSWINVESIDEEDNSTSPVWERNSDTFLPIKIDGLSAINDNDILPKTLSTLLSSKSEDEKGGGEKVDAASSSSSDSSTEEEEEEEEEDDDESEEQSEEEESEEVQPTASSITIGKIDLPKDDASVQESTIQIKSCKEMPSTEPEIKGVVDSTSVQVASESIHSGSSIVTIQEKSTDPLNNYAQISSDREKKLTVESKVAADEKDEDVTRMSVAERAHLFMQKLKSTNKVSAASATPSRFVNRRGLQRSQTQPVTVCEVNEASKIAEELVKRHSNSAEYEDMDIKSNVEATQTNNNSNESEEDPSKLSLADRVKLFNQKMIEVRLPTRKLSTTEEEVTASIPKEKQRRAMASRFKTQPVTSEELEKAQLISKFESQLNKRAEDKVSHEFEEISSASQSSSSDDSKIKGILKRKDDLHSKSSTFVENRESIVNSLTKSIDSKTAANKASTVTELKSILKMDTFIKQANYLKNFKDQEEKSSSSSDDDDDESEGISINVRNGSVNSGVSLASTDEDSSSLSQSSGSGGGKQESGKRIKNEAVLRRRNAALRKQEERKSSDLQHSQSLSISQSFEFTSPALRSVLSGEIVQRNRKILTQRSSTQPLTQMEKDGIASEIKGGSIADRLAALKASQEEDWKRRLERNKTSEVDGNSGSVVSGEESKTIHEKVSLLEVSQQEWRRRVEEKDATKFTVAGKMGKISPPQESPVLERKKRIPKPMRFQSRTCANLPELAKGSPTSPLPPKCPSITRSKSLGDAKDTLWEEKSLTRVSVPKPDDEGFSSFFEAVNLEKLKSQKIEIQDEAFNEIVSESRQFLVQKRSVHVKRRHVGTRNPLKVLAAREDLQSEYTETVTGVAERELKRLRVEQLAKHSDLATSALAGLASTEDFTSVNLRKSSSVVNAPLLPFKDIMLIQVKGRRHVQCRLVEPVVASLNKGDNFILVTSNEVFNWIGEFSNVIERAKASEVANIIQTKKDLGFRGSGEVVTFDEEKKTGTIGKRRDFFEHLGGQDDIADPESPQDDEIYEVAITETNKVFSVEEDELVPYEKYWGCSLRTEMLKNTEVLVFDFGGEMYVWQGKLASNELRKRGVQLAQELWEDGYDYSDCDINPISPCRNSLPKYATKRPPWALFSKVNQHMETVLFRSKFLDWPDLERVIQVKRQESDTKTDSYADLQPYDAQLLIDTKPTEPDYILENCHLGRGVHYCDESERRVYNISTIGVKVWHVSEFNHSILPLESWGQFHSCDTYVVRWQYRIAVTGRDLSGKVSRHSSLGRERCAYFFWQGKHSTINEKGASALMTVELDEERGPHIRVVEGQEPACFLNLFAGKMICYIGKRGSDNSKEKWRLFIVRGEFENEAHLVEVKCSPDSLRESGVFVLVDRKDGVVYMWAGKNVSNHSKDVSRFITENLVQRRPTEMGFQLGMIISMKEEEQGSESNDFLNGLGSVLNCKIPSISSKSLTAAPRLFHMSSVSGSFAVTEILCHFRSCEHVVAYPFLQNELYSSPQPSIFLLDYGNVQYVWQGWWPETNDENDASASAHLRWNIERRLAMETTVSYCKLKGENSSINAYTVWAGLEPLEFKHCFPEWENFPEAAENNKMSGRKEGEKKLVTDVLAQLKRTRYPLAELKERPLPEGVDPSIMETYLSDDEFEEVLKTSKEEFYSLPSWKQTNMKKSAGLY